MGYRDYELLLSSSQNVTAAADSTYYLDTQLTYPYWNKGMPPAVVISVETVNTAATGMSILLCHHTGEPTNTHVFLTAVFLAADMAAGSQLVIPFVQGLTLKQYFRIYYSRTGGTEDYVLTAYVTPLPIYDR